ncbi:hypothetical protein BDR26DRAFT_879981 [Obelidium mucronatum]|nr:hypothetical protein BDR26DRAFT_879981 [Obelidium mucronatum]
MNPKQCRNVLIHGFCKYENSGCEFSHGREMSGFANSAALHHPGSVAPQAVFQTSASPDWKKGKLRFDSPEFKPSNIISAPSFAPSALSSHVGFNAFESSFGAENVDQAYPGYTSSRASVASVNNYEDNLIGGFGAMGVSNAFRATPQLQQQHHHPLHQQQQQQMQQQQKQMQQQQLQLQQQKQQQDRLSGLGSGSAFFQQLESDPFAYPDIQQGSPQQIQKTPSAPLQPLQYHLYSPALPHVTNIPPHCKPIHYFFMEDKLREQLQRQSEASQSTLDPNSPEAQSLPSEVHVYHSLFPLDDKQDRHSKVFGFPTSVYKAISSVDGRPYVLRRIEGFRLLSETAMSSIEGWRRINHASIVSVREAFTTKSFGDNSLVFVYDYHPLSTTLSAKYFVVSPLRPGVKLGVPEKSLWSYIIQISSAIKTLHSAGLAARILEPSKILVTGKNRVRLNCCGIFDMINFDGGKNTLQFQQDDLVNFGRLIVSLACGSLAAVHNLPKSLEYISRQYSIDLKNVILLLLSKRSNYKSIDEVLTMIMPRILQEANSANSYNDILESELMKETENGRVVRLLAKLGFINERPEFDMDPSWSETGDRYLLKLFRDYVFHQVDELGNPVVDVGHVLQCLNKLDAGVDERIMLMSRDEQSCLIVSYKELKQCIETSFGLLSRQ